MRIPVRSQLKPSARLFARGEETHTLAISAHGAANLLPPRRVPRAALRSFERADEASPGMRLWLTSIDRPPTKFRLEWSSTAQVEVLGVAFPKRMDASPDREFG